LLDAAITYTLDQMDSDIISRLKTPDGSLVLLPYPVVTVDMGQQLARMKSPTEIETLWLDYVLELVAEASADPAPEATTVVRGIHPLRGGSLAAFSCTSRPMTRSG
jgi:allantoinase